MLFLFFATCVNSSTDREIHGEFRSILPSPDQKLEQVWRHGRCCTAVSKLTVKEAQQSASGGLETDSPGKYLSWKTWKDAPIS